MQWNVSYKITRWPSFLCLRTSAPYLFSPNFTFQLDFSYKEGTISILKTETQEVYLELPPDMINTEWRDLNENQAIDLIFSRIKWESDPDEDKLRIVT